jgi:hypothetical protein
MDTRLAVRRRPAKLASSAALCGLLLGGPTTPSPKTLTLRAYSEDLMNLLNTGLYCRACINDAAAKMAG